MTSKSKVKHNQKDINIVIEIENNLLSKNKMKADEDMPEKKKIAGKGMRSSQSTPPNLNKANQNILSDYLAITSARDFYNSNRTQPLNLTHYLNPPPIQQNTPIQTTQIPATVEGNTEEYEGNDDEENFQDTLDYEVEEEGYNEIDYPIFDIDQEDAYDAGLSAIDRSKRTVFINKIKNTSNPTYKIKKDIVKRLKLGYYLKKHRPDTWDRIKNNTWSY